MRPIVTWVLLANAGIARVVANHGPGKGFVAMGGRTWHAEDPVEYSDKPGLEKSGNAYGSVALPSGDPKDAAETAFAIQVSAELEAFVRSGQFDRMIICAAPRMLGKLRAAIAPSVQNKVTAEVDKDLTQINLVDLPKHLRDVIAA